MPDPRLARSFTEQSRRFLGDGSDARNHGESRQLLLHAAAIAACDAILAIAGFQVEGSEGGHVLRLHKAQELVDSDLDGLFEQLDVLRLTRAEVSYRAGFAPRRNLEEATAAVVQLVQLAEAYTTRSDSP